MVSLEDYAGREQAYVKHVFLERYLEALVFKTASTYNHIVSVDGFAGPWQSASEQFEDRLVVVGEEGRLEGLLCLNRRNGVLCVDVRG